MLELGVNIDHVATVRQARRTNEPDPVWAAAAAELGGADSITIHLREDRRHIVDRDLNVLGETVRAKLNLEMACTDEMLKIACAARPDQATLVPERREEITTEGGLDVAAATRRIGEAVRHLQQSGITVSLFIDPDERQIEASLAAGADAVELHTGAYALAARGSPQDEQRAALEAAARHVLERGLGLHAGHGLTYHNVQPVAAIDGMRELNIGHSIVARALIVGMSEAVRQMKALMDDAAGRA